jgi:hypothetical protein
MRWESLTPLVLLELSLVRECDAIDTLQGLLGHISTPEGTAAVGHTNSLQHTAQDQHTPLSDKQPYTNIYVRRDKHHIASHTPA